MHTNHAPELGGEPIIDRVTLDKLAYLGGEEDPDLVHELIELFLHDAEQRIRTLARAVELGDLESAGKAAHSLKSASSNVGAASFSGKCLEIERTAREGLDVRELVDDGLAMFDDVKQALVGIQEYRDRKS